MITRSLPILLLAAASPAHAGWTVTNLHPAGMADSYALGIGLGPSGLRQVGYVNLPSGIPNAALWAGSAASFVNLSPMDQLGTIAYDTDDEVQVGIAGAGGFFAASRWTGTGASWQNIGGSASALSIENGLIVGYVSSGLPASNDACYWQGGTIVPIGGSSANGTTGTAIAMTSSGTGFPTGFSDAYYIPSTTSAPILLDPPGSYHCSAIGISASQQVGAARLTQFGPSTAALWSGSAASFVNLHPASAPAHANSGAVAVDGGVQVGFVQLFDPDDPNMNLVDRAALWHSTAASFVNLHDLLPASFHTSTATGILTQGDTIYVVGHGTIEATGRDEALMWTFAPAPPCGSGDFDCDGDSNTDADIESFFACLAGTCPVAPCTSTADFDGDGDSATDADIEAFFRVLAGGDC
jgi:hypothetical protein